MSRPPTSAEYLDIAVILRRAWRSGKDGAKLMARHPAQRAYYLATMRSALRGYLWLEEAYCG